MRFGIKCLSKGTVFLRFHPNSPIGHPIGLTKYLMYFCAVTGVSRKAYSYFQPQQLRNAFPEEIICFLSPVKALCVTPYFCTLFILTMMLVLCFYQSKKSPIHIGRGTRDSTYFHIYITAYTLRSTWPSRIPCLYIGRTRESLLLFQPTKLRKALQHPIRTRSHHSGSLCRHQTAYSFRHRFVVEEYNTIHIIRQALLRKYVEAQRKME